MLPGGESSVHLALIERFGLEESVLASAREGKPLLATCAGLILVAARSHRPEAAQLRSARRKCVAQRLRPAARQLRERSR